MNIAAILGEAGRDWVSVPGAAEEQIQRLVALSPVRLPDELLDLLRLSDGGEGDLALAPRCFILDGVEEALRSLQDPHDREHFAGFVFFGGNGGLERIALDCREGTPPWPVVMIDPIAGPGSAEVIAPSFAVFLSAVGLPYPDEDGADPDCPES
jgi:hypothetical protein